MKKMQKARAEALEAALGALSAGVGHDAAWTAEPAEVLTYAKFILGKRPAKKKRRRYDDGGWKVDPAEVRVAKFGTPLPRTEEELKDWTPLGYLTEDGLKEDPSFSVADLFRGKAPVIPGPPTIAGATLEKFAEKVRDGDLAADPVPAKVEDPIDLRGIFPYMPGTRHEDAAVDELDRGKAAGCPECAEELERRGLTDLNVPDPEETSLLEVRTRLDSTEADEEFPRPVGEDPGDRDTLLQWAEEVRRRNAEQEASLEGEKLEKTAGDTLPPADDGRPLWSTRPEVRTVTLTPSSSPVDKRLAEETMGLVPGALDEELTITNEGTFLPDGSPAEVSLREVEVGKTNDSAGAKNWVLQEGVRVGCPECTAEAERRKDRDARLKEGRAKLARRLQVLRPNGPLDEDELLAVAGSELYPAGDEEPSRELKIRNRKGEVRSYVSGAKPDGYPSAGWTVDPANAWGIANPWTSSEMDRRGPWHVV